MSPAEIESYRQRGAARWFRDAVDAPEGEGGDPFEPIPGWRGHQRIRKRADGACGFLSMDNRCRLHEELGGARKPLTCRVFPYRFHPAPEAVIVTTSFGCPTVVANQGELVNSGRALDEVRGLRAEWFTGHRLSALPRQYVPGRPIGPDSLGILRQSLLRMLDRADRHGARDLRQNVRGMSAMLDDLTRRRVVRLPDAGFAEYVALTLPYAASRPETPAIRRPSRVGRMLQHGFRYVVAATRLRVEQRAASRWRVRLDLLRLLAHFHGLAPALGRVNVRRLGQRPVDVNKAELQPGAHHYLRACIQSLGARDRPVLDDFAIAVSCLNAAAALAEMNALDADRLVDEHVLREALMDAADLLHLDGRGLLGRALSRLAGGVEALYAFAASTAADASIPRQRHGCRHPSPAE